LDHVLIYTIVLIFMIGLVFVLSSAIHVVSGLFGQSFLVHLRQSDEKQKWDI